MKKKILALSLALGAFALILSENSSIITRAWRICINFERRYDGLLHRPHRCD